MSNRPVQALPSSELPAATPTYVLRGHASAIHSLLFSKSNLELYSGDSEGWVVIWLLTTKRPIAVWRAHDGAILGMQMWTDSRIVTHGRDGKLRVWGLGDLKTAQYSIELPVEDTNQHRKEPWMYHSLDVSSLTFCSFDACMKISRAENTVELPDTVSPQERFSEGQPDTRPDAILVAVPGTKDSSIDIIELPSEKPVAMIPAPDQSNSKTGMVMAIRITYHTDGRLIVIAGYESGRTYVFKQVIKAGQWESIYTSRPHSQPILSVDISPHQEWFITSGADAIVAKHSLSSPNAEGKPIREIQTRHSGQQGLSIRRDDKVFATAGWDGRGRVYSAKTMRELAVLKWHKEGCYALAFANIQAIKPASNTTSSHVEVDNQLTRIEPHFQSLSESRTKTAQSTHWLSLGSKDGKISLWDIY